MKISDLSALLSKVQQIAGDVDVTLQDSSSGATSVVLDLVIHLDPQSGSTSGALAIEHGPAPAAPAAPPESPPATPV